MYTTQQVADRIGINSRAIRYARITEVAGEPRQLGTTFIWSEEQMQILKEHFDKKKARSEARKKKLGK